MVYPQCAVNINIQLACLKNTKLKEAQLKESPLVGWDVSRQASRAELIDVAHQRWIPRQRKQSLAKEIIRFASFLHS